MVEVHECLKNEFLLQSSEIQSAGAITFLRCLMVKRRNRGDGSLVSKQGHGGRFPFCSIRMSSFVRGSKEGGKRR